MWCYGHVIVFEFSQNRIFGPYHLGRGPEEPLLISPTHSTYTAFHLKLQSPQSPDNFPTISPTSSYQKRHYLNVLQDFHSKHAFPNLEFREVAAILSILQLHPRLCVDLWPCYSLPIVPLHYLICFFRLGCWFPIQLYSNVSSPSYISLFFKPNIKFLERFSFQNITWPCFW